MTFKDLQVGQVFHMVRQGVTFIDAEYCKIEPIEDGDITWTAYYTELDTAMTGWTTVRDDQEVAPVADPVKLRGNMDFPLRWSEAKRRWKLRQARRAQKTNRTAAEIVNLLERIDHASQSSRGS